MKAREEAVREGRAMVRVRRVRTGELATAGVCPACWNLRARRPALVARLEKEGLVVADAADRIDGAYLPLVTHAPGCPWRKL
jgi:hypothetical protein